MAVVCRLHIFSKSVESQPSRHQNNCDKDLIRVFIYVFEARFSKISPNRIIMESLVISVVFNSITLFGAIETFHTAKLCRSQD